MADIIKREHHIVDAQGKALGRLATEIAKLLRGKGKVTFVPYIDAGDFVSVKNVDKMTFSGNKFTDKKYYRFTGYLGNLKSATPREIVAKKGYSEILRMAVMGMLCKNKLRARQIKRLKFEK